MPKMQLVCDHCGVSYVSHQRGKNYSFCSIECRRNAAQRVSASIDFTQRKPREKPASIEVKRRKSKAKEKYYAIYKADELIVLGTLDECAAFLNVKPETIRFMTSPTHMKRNTGGQRMEAIIVEDDEKEETNERFTTGGLCPIHSKKRVGTCR